MSTWDDYLDSHKMPDIEDNDSPSKASRLSDPGAGPHRGTLSGADPDRAPAMTIDALVLLGGSKDERGFYRLYGRVDDERPPF